MMLLMGICTSLTKYPVKPISKKPVATALPIAMNSTPISLVTYTNLLTHAYCFSLPSLVGFVHLLSSHLLSEYNSDGKLMTVRIKLSVCSCFSLIVTTV